MVHIGPTAKVSQRPSSSPQMKHRPKRTASATLPAATMRKSGTPSMTATNQGTGRPWASRGSRATRGGGAGGPAIRLGPQLGAGPALGADGVEHPLVQAVLQPLPELDPGGDQQEPTPVRRPRDGLAFVL